MILRGIGDPVTAIGPPRIENGGSGDPPFGVGAKKKRTSDYARADRSRRFWNRSTWPAVSMIVCLPVKNGWQFEQTSTRSSGLVDPTVHSVPQDPQWTLASKYLG
jgi:hypothetical protein